MGKMFKTITQTWNPFTGCEWRCSYCWARRLAEGKLKKQYQHGFVPEFHPNRVERHFKPGEFVFVSSMGDISFCPDYDFVEIQIPTLVSCTVKLQVAEKTGGTFYDLGDGVTTPAGAHNYADVFNLGGYQFIKVVADNNQDAERLIRVRGMRF